MFMRLKKAREKRSSFFDIEILSRESNLLYPPGGPEKLELYADPVNLLFPCVDADSTKHSLDEFDRLSDLYERRISYKKVREYLARALRRYGVVSVERAELSLSKEEASLIKVDADMQICASIVYTANRRDLQGHRAKPDVVQKMAFEFIKNLNVYTGPGFMHKEFDRDIDIIGTWYTFDKMLLGETEIPPHSWIMMFKVHDEDIWKGIKEGIFTGISLAGIAHMEDDEDE